MILRNYQADTARAVLKEFETVNSTLVVLPTGTGKTVIVAEIIKAFYPKRTIFLAHRDTLIYQGKRTIEAHTNLTCDIEMAHMEAGSNLFDRSSIVLSTVQTQLAGANGNGRMTRFDPKEFGLLIADESHHYTSPGWRKVIDYYRQNSSLKFLGVTATPDRADEEALGQIFDTVAYDYEILDAIHDGWLVPIEQQMVKIEGLDFSHVKITAGDLNGAQLARVMEAEQNLQGVAGASIDIIGQRRAIIFTASVAHAEMTSNILNRHRQGMSAWVCDKTDKVERQKLLKAFADGTVQVVCNCGILTEGFDDPGVEVCVMARPTKSRSLYAQMIGRTTRALPGVVDGPETPEARKAAIAASGKPSCIAEGERVLTDHGLVPIEKVMPHMKVWDGLEFVTHCGILFRGEQPIIKYAGLKATPDHKVWTQKGWQTFRECASQQIPISVTGIGGQEIRQALCRYRGDYPQSQRATVRPDGMRLRSAPIQGFDECFTGKGGMQNLRSAGELPPMALAAVRSGPTKMYQPQRSELREIRRQRNPVLFPFGEPYGPLGEGVSRSAPGVDTGPEGQSRPLRSRKSSLRQRPGATKQQAWQEIDTRNSCIQIGIPECGILRRPSATFDSQRGNLERYSSKTQTERPVQRKAKVFDIINAGPRHCFTVEGLLVKNCLVVDFVGNSGKHKLMTSADILGGKVSEAAIERAIKKAQEDGKAMRMDELLDRSEEEIRAEIETRRIEEEARKAKLVARVKFQTQTISPFEAFDLQPVKERGWDRAKQLSVKQTALLQKQGIDPGSLTFTQARQVIGEIFSRWQNKQCSYRQARILKARGYDTHVSMQEASAILDIISANEGWKTKAA